jgi:hypothetical protein
MLSRKPRALALTVLSLSAVAAGSANPLPSDESKDPTASPPPKSANTDDANPTPAPGRMIVAGRVLDPEGKPVPGAAVMVHARDLSLWRPHFFARKIQIPLADARTDGSGRFRIDAPRTSSTQHMEFGAVAMAPGYGVGWVMLDPDDDQPTAEISLRAEQVIQGRLFDVQGRPVPDVEVFVQSIRSDHPLSRARLNDRYIYRRSDGVIYWRPRDTRVYPAWPRPMTTDAEGRFTVRGVGRNLHAELSVHHPRFALQRIPVGTDDNAESKPVTWALAPTQIVNVRVTYADTGEPVPHSPLEVVAGRTIDESETDDAGRARVNSWPAQAYYVTAYPPEGQPYLIARGQANWPKGALEQTLNLALPRGVLVYGKVREEGSGKPIPRAHVQFHTGARNGEDVTMTIRTGSDGSFRLGAEPKPGHLFIRGPDDDYVFQAIDSRVVREGQPGGGRLYSHAYAALDLKPGMGSHEVNLVIRRGAMAEGRVVGPDDQPVGEAWIFSRLILEPSEGAFMHWRGLYHGKLRNGRFEIRGLAPGADVPVYFLEPERKLGAVVNLSAKSMASGPYTVRLEPCGSARAWLIDPDGKPVAKPVRGLNIRMVVTPGSAMNAHPNEKEASLLSADEGELTDVDPINYETAPAPDVLGRIELPVLIPGATYRLIDHTMYVQGQTGPEIRKEFTIKPGQKLNLGDIRIAKPPS